MQYSMSLTHDSQRAQEPGFDFGLHIQAATAETEAGIENQVQTMCPLPCWVAGQQTRTLGAG